MEFLLKIFGAVALLIWGTHIVTDGVMEGFGSKIRLKIGQALESRYKAFITGFVVTLGLQSSTATAMMAASFSGNGMLAFVPGFMLMLGANVGTSVVAKILSFPIYEIAPLLLVLGVFLPRFIKTSQTKNIAEIFFGLGLMLFSLGLLVTSTDHIQQSPLANQVISGMASQEILIIICGIIAAWICHSSVAVVLLAASLVGTGTIPLEAALGIVLGANLGGALGPVLDTDGIESRRLPIANLVVRGLGVIFGSMLIHPIAELLVSFHWNPAAMLVNAHLAFNISLALVAMPFNKPICNILLKLLPDPPNPSDPGKAKYLLKWNAQTSSNMFLTSIEREVFRSADLLGEQLSYLPRIIKSNSQDEFNQLKKVGSSVTSLCNEIRNNIASVPVKMWNTEEHIRIQEVEVFVLSMEHASDIITNQIVFPLYRRYKMEGDLNNDDKNILIKTSENMIIAQKLSVSAFLRRDVDASKQVISHKIKMRKMERKYMYGYDKGRSSSLNLKNIDDDLRLMREMGRVIGQCCAIAYEVLEQSGKLRSRIVYEEKK